MHWIAAAASLLTRVLPLPAVRWFGWLFGSCVYALSYSRRRLMTNNIRAVFGDAVTPREASRIARASVINIGKTLAELLKLRWLTEADVKREVSLEGREHLDAGLAAGKGVIIIAAHFGNWEYAGAIMAISGYPINVIARDASDVLTRNLINSARESKGVKVFGRRDVRYLLSALKSNECVAILPDQHAKDGAVRIELLGRPADTATGPATIALRTGAAIIPIFTYRQAHDHLHSEVMPPLELVQTGDRDADIITNTQKINDLIGEKVREHPEQWMWLHDRWKAERDVEQIGS